jgi:hypothetical protein
MRRLSIADQDAQAARVDECPMDAGDAVDGANDSRRVVWSALQFGGQQDASRYRAVERNNFRTASAIVLLDRSTVHVLSIRITPHALKAGGVKQTIYKIIPHIRPIPNLNYYKLDQQI